MAKKKSKKTKKKLSKLKKKRSSKNLSKVSSKRGSRASSRRSPSRSSGGDTYPVICSDCFAEFDLPSSTEQETIKCAVCGHGCKMPEQDFFNKFDVHLSQEKKHAFIGVTLGIVMMGLFIAYMFLLSHPGYAMKFGLMKEDLKPQTLHYVFGGGIAICVIGLIVESVFYEKSIHHAYF